MNSRKTFKLTNASPPKTIEVDRMAHRATSQPTSLLPETLLWGSYLKQHTSNRWLSQAVIRGLMPEYAENFDGSPIWGHARMDELEDRIPDAIELSAGTSRKARKPQAHVLEAARKAIDDGYTDFASTKGYRDFREAIARKLKDENHVEYDPDTEICPTTGCQQAIDGTFRILVDPGDEVLLIDPEYASFEPSLRWYGAKVVPMPLSERNGRWSFDVDELSKRVTTKTKLLVMSNPNNPVGILYTRKELNAIADLAQDNDFLVASDELYEKLIFDGRRHTSIAALPGMKERTVMFIGFSKLDHISGFRVGFAASNRDIIEQMCNVVRFTTQCAPSIGQRAALASLIGPRDWIQQVVGAYKKKRDFTVRELNKMKGVRCHYPDSGYFAFPDFSAYGIPSQYLAEYILVEGRVKTIPGFWFGRNGEGHLRISYSVGVGSITEGLTRLKEAVERLPLH
jgi:aminotransferase